MVFYAPKIGKIPLKGDARQDFLLDIMLWSHVRRVCRYVARFAEEGGWDVSGISIRDLSLRSPEGLLMACSYVSSCCFAAFSLQSHQGTSSALSNLLHFSWPITGNINL